MDLLMGRGKSLAILAAALLVAGPVGADESVPSRYLGFWAVGGCDSPQLYMSIADTTIHAFGADRGTPVADWNVNDVGGVPGGLALQFSDTSTGRAGRLELRPDADGWMAGRIVELEAQESQDLRLQRCDTGPMIRSLSFRR